MDKIYFSDLNNLIENKHLGSESIRYNCIFNNKEYLYKQPLTFNEEDANKMKKLTNINNSSLVTPKLIIHGDRYGKPIGYLVDYYDNYKSLYFADLPLEQRIKVLKITKEKIITMHNYGIIHCDLHLANIILHDDDVKIVDFDTAQYLNYSAHTYNKYTSMYLENNKLSESVDIYNFNIDTFSYLYRIAWDEVFRLDFTKKLNAEQNNVWQKTKERKELTYDDFLIDRFS